MSTIDLQDSFHTLHLDLDSPKTLKQTCTFCGMLNFSSKKFKWTDEAETAFKDIKYLLINPLVLRAPTPDGLFRLEGVGSTLF